MKIRRCIALIVLVCAALLSSRPALAQFSQEGPKLVGAGAVGSYARQGYSVSLSGDGNTAVVGGLGDNGSAGAAWVWTRSGGVWIQQGTKLVGSNAVGSAGQGYSASLSGDGNTAIVGGFVDNSEVGAAWVWTRSGGVWTQQGTKLVGSDAVGSAQQGYSVSLSSDGNIAIVGGYFDNNHVGAAWVWTRSGGVWTQQGTKLVGSDAVGSAQQGSSVSLSGDGNTAVVGGNGDNGSAGAAWLWTRSGGVWTQQGPKLVGSDAAGPAFQGFSVSLSGDGNTAVVGGNGDNGSAGAAWLWTRSGGVWTQQGPKLVGSGAVGASQGFSVSLSADGNTAIVGGFTDNNAAGAAWIWTRSGGVWTQQGTKLVGSGAVGNAEQGVSVSSSSDGKTAIVGGPYDNSGPGAAWVFTSSAPAVFPAPTPSGPTGSGVSAKPTFSWSAVTGATSYRLMVSTVVGALPTDPASSICSGCAINTTTPTNYYIPSIPLSATTTYYWQVQALSATQNGTWSTPTSFTTAPPPEQTPPDRGNLPEDSGSWPTPASKAVVITHGWKDGATPTLDPLILLPWVEEMAGKVCGKLGAGLTLPSGRDGYLSKRCQANNWDVWILDWRSKAATGWNNPMGAYVNAIDVGQNLASNLKGKNYSHIHLIAHSAGANLIDFATIWLKVWVTTENRPALEIHETFLDAYGYVSDPSRYGKQADWTDNYVDTRNVADLFWGLDGTKLFLQNGYNIDVTPTAGPDPCTQFSWPPDVWGCRHNRPYRFYGLSVDSSFVGDAPSAAYDPIPTNGTGAMGYPLSWENNVLLSTLNNAYPKGAKCVMNGGVCYAGSLPPSGWTLLAAAVAGTVVDGVTGTINYVAGVGSTLFDSLKLGLNSFLPNAGTAVPTARSATPTESPSWISAQVTTTEPVNTMRFSWRFAASGEGYLRVFVDGALVREIDQLHVSLASLTTEQIYIGGGAGTLAPGIHRIAFRLDGFGTSASGVELTGVELGLNVPAETVPATAALFYTLPPCRVLDTRNPTGPLGASALQPGATRAFDVAASACGIPADAVTISANLTVTTVGAQGDLVIFPSDILRPNSSAISFQAGRTRANNAIVSLSKSSKTFSVFNNSAATVDFILDVNGFFR